jgi:hypothetical protein
MDRIERAIAKPLMPILALHGFKLQKNRGFFVPKQA